MTTNTEREELIQFVKDHACGGSNFNAKMERVAALLAEDKWEPFLFVYFDPTAGTHGAHKVAETHPPPADAFPVYTRPQPAQPAQPAQVHQWQPIETAPKDGTNVLLINWKGNIASGLWLDGALGSGWFLRGSNAPNVFFNGHHGPTHWMPLPAAPGAEQPAAQVPLNCEWVLHEMDDYYQSACGEAWQFNDGGPKENNVRFCQGCGKPVTIGKDQA